MCNCCLQIRLDFLLLTIADLQSKYGSLKMNHHLHVKFVCIDQAPVEIAASRRPDCDRDQFVYHFGADFSKNDPKIFKFYSLDPSIGSQNWSIFGGFCCRTMEREKLTSLSSGTLLIGWGVDCHPICGIQAVKYPKKKTSRAAKNWRAKVLKGVHRSGMFLRKVHAPILKLSQKQTMK